MTTLDLTTDTGNAPTTQAPPLRPIAAPHPGVPLDTSEPPDPAPEQEWDHSPLPIRPPRRQLSPLTMLLSGLLLGAASFAGGVVVEKRQLPTTTGTSGRTSATAQGATSNRQGSGQGAGAGATTGTVKLIDGSNIYVTDDTGTIIKILTTPQSDVTITATGPVASIRPGDNIVISGPTNPDGTISATTVRDSGPQGTPSGRSNRGG